MFVEDQFKKRTGYICLFWLFLLLWQVGMTLHCRVTRVNMEKFQVDLSSRSSDLADKEGKFRWECSASLYGLFSCSWAKRRSRSVTFDLIIAAFPRTCTMTKPLLRRTKRRNRWHWRRQTGQVSCQPGTDFNLNQNYQTKPKGVVTKRKAFGEMEKEFILMYTSYYTNESSWCDLQSTLLSSQEYVQNYGKMRDL